MPNIPEYQSVLDIRYGADPYLDALLLHFMTENNLEYSIDPAKNASPEQIRFMVALRGNTFYAPCSDWMFLQLLKAGLTKELLDEYLEQWKNMIRLVRENVTDRYTKRRIIGLCRHKFRLALSSPIMIPSRLMKHMETIFLTQSGLDDPKRKTKQRLNKRAKQVIDSQEFDRIVNSRPQQELVSRRIDDLRFEMDMLELERLLAVSTIPELWSDDKLEQGLYDTHKEIEERPVDFSCLRELFGQGRGCCKKILYLPDMCGGIMFDLAVVRSLLRQGHKVVLALKEGYYQEQPTFWDVEHDSVLAEAMQGAHFLSNNRVSKNELLRALREHSFVVVSDGSRERFNPYRLSVTLARAWKECDFVLAKGEGTHRRIELTSHQFTRDVLCFFRDPDGRLQLHCRQKAPWVRKLGEEYITAKADEIIDGMRKARAQRRSVMFYSGIVGSIPGQVKTAIEVMTAFVNYLRTRMEDVLIINPAEHFEEGMDADDLMFMWEKVQRSGYINIWRFQSTEDIAKSFELMNRKVPYVWAGKDATYSTGCTKEMHIALDVQRTSPEMQILGPEPDKFFRRREYGVGRFCDVAIDECD